MYDYREERAYVFSEGGQRQFLSIRDRTDRLIRQAGAARMQEMISGETGTTWEMMACVDRLVELGEIEELTGVDTSGQYRVFIKKF